MFTITPGDSGVQQTLDSPTILQAVRFTNKTPYDLKATGFGLTGQEWLAAGVEYMLRAEVNNVGYINLQAFNNSNLSPAPAANVLLTEYLNNEKLPQGTWPVSIPTQVVQGSLTTTTANNVQNDGNPPGTIFVESTVSGDSASAVKLTNDAKLDLGTALNPGHINVRGPFSSDNGGILTDGNSNLTIAGKIIVNSINSIINNLQVNNSLNVNGGSSFDSGGIATTGSGELQFNNSPQTLNGSTAGVLQYECCIFGGLTITTFQTVGYQNNTAIRQHITLPQTYNHGAILLIGGLLNPASNGVYLYHGGTGGTLLTANQWALGPAGGAGSSSSQTHLRCLNIFEITNAIIDTFEMDGNLTGLGQGFAILAGN